MPETTSTRLGYADDWALDHQFKDWAELENVLSQDIAALKAFFDRWYLKMNISKLMSTAFHLDNKQAQRTLRVMVNDKILPPDRSP